MRYHSILRTLLAGSALLALSSAAVAQEETKLDLITVIIGKVKQSLQDAVGGVSVATRKDLEQHGSSSVSDVLAPMPGVSTEENANDPAQAVNVRGLQDFGRVAVTIDGARQNFQRTGHNADGMFYFEPEMMQQVTVTRGPSGQRLWLRRHRRRCVLRDHRFTVLPEGRREHRRAGKVPLQHQR